MADYKLTRKESRNSVLANLWMRHGCPEKMTVHVRKTGETIVLINGMVLEPEVKTTERPCAECGRPLPVGKPKFCSPQCRSRSGGETRRRKMMKQAEEAMKILSPRRVILPPVEDGTAKDMSHHPGALETASQTSQGTKERLISEV